jgi:hypothetical protein
MLQLDGTARTGRRADAASRADRFNHLGDRPAVSQFIFNDSAKGTGLDALETTHACIGIDLSNGGV